jgi:hypothetical protein
MCKEKDMDLKACSIGGKIRGVQLRKEALELYYSNPNKCLLCGKIIEVNENNKVSTIRKKKFCDKKCAASFNNKIRVLNKDNSKIKDERYYFKLCKLCNKEFSTTNRNKLKCEECVTLKSISNNTKKELFISRKNWQSARSSIAKHAAEVYKKSNKIKKCLICGYDIHCEVCHKKPVSDFSDETIISEINNIDNLVALCSNHHWELDHRILKI